jgi:hypothetical protein
MTFDQEGHVVVTPVEVQTLLHADLHWLICHVLLQGTPAVFATYNEYCRFRGMVAEDLAVHPSSIVFRGSTKIGFSLSPRPDKVWVAMGADSDVDLAIVDPDHFHFLDAEVRRWERNIQRWPEASRDRGFARSRRLRENRAFYCYKYMDLPDTALVEKYQIAMRKASSPRPLGCHRYASAFFFRDWWSLHSRYEFDLRQLLNGLGQSLPAATEDARMRNPPVPPPAN